MSGRFRGSASPSRRSEKVPPSRSTPGIGPAPERRVRVPARTAPRTGIRASIALAGAALAGAALAGAALAGAALAGPGPGDGWLTPQGGDQVTMLAPLILDALAKVQAGEVQALHLLKQMLQGLRQAPVPRRLGEPDVELAALSDHRRKPLVRIDLEGLLGERAQRLQLVCSGAFRGERCGRWFQEKTEVEDLLDIGEGEIRHTVALTRQDLDESLVAEHRQGFADRRLAHTQLLGEAAFVQPCTGGQLAGEDLLLEDSVDPG